jgi:predicted amidophosphoribosyltransferase
MPPLTERLGSVFFPSTCVGCGALGSWVCPACVAALHRAPATMAPSGFMTYAAAFTYDGHAREVITRMKYRARHHAGPWLAAAIVAAAVRHGVEAPDLVTWAPTSGVRRRARGYDQAARLARAIGAQLGVPAVATLRRLSSAPQTGAARAARLAGPEFSPRLKFAARPFGSPFERVWVVDDVVTTGATMVAAGVALHRFEPTWELHGVSAAYTAKHHRSEPPAGLRPGIHHSP